MNSRPIILCYHRIVDNVSFDRNKLSVSPRNFQTQIEFLKKTRKFVTLNEMISERNANTVAVTFDDGYRDNYKIAANILTDYEIPASFFLATRFIDQSVSYYTTSFNKIWGFFQQTREVPSPIAGSIVEQLLRTENSYFQALRQLSSLAPSRLWRASELLHLAVNAIGRIDDLELPLSVNEVHSLVESDLFTIGPHTATHPRMSSIHIEDALSDFAESVTTVASWGGSQAQYFPYPFGQRSDFNRTLESRIKNSFEFKGLSTFPMSLGRGKSDLLTLPRLSVQDWDINTFRYIVNIADAFSYAPFAAIAALKVSAGIRKLGRFT